MVAVILFFFFSLFFLALCPFLLLGRTVGRTCHVAGGTAIWCQLKNHRHMRAQVTPSVQQTRVGRWPQYRRRERLHLGPVSYAGVYFLCVPIVWNRIFSQGRCGRVNSILEEGPFGPFHVSNSTKSPYCCCCCSFFGFFFPPFLWEEGEG